MKYPLIVLCLVFISFSYSQDCNQNSLFFTKGTTFTYTLFNKKGKELANSTHKVEDVTREKDITKSTVVLSTEDPRQKSFYSTKYNIRCREGIVSIDMLCFLNINNFLQYSEEGFVIDFDGDMIDFPENLNENSSLRGGFITADVSTIDGFAVVSATKNITDRIVLDQETISTPAGSFDCIKISFDYESSFGQSISTGNTTNWYTKDYVLVKSETYSKKNKLVSYTELTELKSE